MVRDGREVGMVRRGVHELGQAILGELDRDEGAEGGAYTREGNITN